MKPETTEWLEGIAADFTAQSNPAQAPAMAAYMKHHFPFLGIKKPERAALAKPWLAKGNRPERSDLPELCAVLWQKPEREWAYLALELTRLELKTLQFSDLPWLMELVRSRSWWDTVDLLASDRIGRTLLRYPDQHASFLLPLVESTNGWDNRTAIIAQLRWKKQTDVELLEAAIVPHLASTWFFHRKAIGWALREYRKTDPEWVADFLEKYGSEMSGLSRREALR